MAKLIANTKQLSREKWLQLRKDGIGGSDAAAVAGASKYSSPIMVYMDKLNMYLPEKKEHVMEAANWGNLHEPTIREEFKRRINIERAEQNLPPLKVIHRQAIYAHDEHDFIRTNLDGVVYDHELGKGIFEAKTAHYMLRDEWAGEDVPNAYYIQVQHNMLVMDAPYAYLAVLIGGNQYKHYFIERDQEFIDYLIMIETQFWNNHILQRIPPAMSGLPAENEMLRDEYPQSENREGEILTLPTVCIELAERADATKQMIKVLEQEQAAAENEIKAIMGTTESAFAGSHKITWKTASNGVRSMRIKLDAQEDRNKFYNSRIKEIDKERKTIEKERKEIEKERKAMEKEAIKARKAAEKAIKDAIKAEKKALKEAKGEPIERFVPPIDATLVNTALDDLRDDVQYMRENGEHDLRTVLHFIDDTQQAINTNGEEQTE